MRYIATYQLKKKLRDSLSLFLSLNNLLYLLVAFQNIQRIIKIHQ